MCIRDSIHTVVRFGEGDWVKFWYMVRVGMKEWMTGIYCVLHREKIDVPEWFRNKYRYNNTFKLEDLPEKPDALNMWDVPFQQALNRYCFSTYPSYEYPRIIEFLDMLGIHDGQMHNIIPGLLAMDHKRRRYMYIEEDPFKDENGSSDSRGGYGWVRCKEPNSARLQSIREKLKNKLNTIRAYQKELEEYRKYERELYCNYEPTYYDTSVSDNYSPLLDNYSSLDRDVVCTGHCDNDICPKRFFQQKVRWRIEDAAITRFTNHETLEVREWWFQQERINNVEELEELIEEQRLYISQRG